MNNIIGEWLCGYLKYNSEEKQQKLFITGICENKSFVKIENAQFLSESEKQSIKNLNIKNIGIIRKNPVYEKASLLSFMLIVPDKQENDELLIKNVSDISKESNKYASMSKENKKVAISIDKHKRFLDIIETEWNNSSMKKIFDNFDICLGENNSPCRTVISQEDIIKKYFAYLNYVYSQDKKHFSGVCYPDPFFSNALELSNYKISFHYRADDYFKAVNYVFAALNCIPKSFTQQDKVSYLQNNFKQGTKVLYNNSVYEYERLDLVNNQILLKGGNIGNLKIAIASFSLCELMPYEGNVQIGGVIGSKNHLFDLSKESILFFDKIMKIKKENIPIISNCSSFFLIDEKKDYELLNEIYFRIKGTNTEIPFNKIFSYAYFGKNGKKVSNQTTSLNHYNLILFSDFYNLLDELLISENKKNRILSLTLNRYDYNFNPKSLTSLEKIILMTNFSKIRSFDKNDNKIKGYLNSTFIPLGKICDYTNGPKYNSPSNTLLSWELDDIKNKKINYIYYDTSFKNSDYTEFARNVNSIKSDKNLVNGKQFAIQAFSIRKNICTAISYDDCQIRNQINELKNSVLPQSLDDKKCKIITFLENLSSKISYETKLSKICSVLDELNKKGLENFNGQQIKQSVLFVVSGSTKKFMDTLIEYRQRNKLIYDNLRIEYSRDSLKRYRFEEAVSDEKNSYYDNLIYLYDRNCDFDFYESNKSINKIVITCDFFKNSIQKEENNSIQNLNDWCDKSPFTIKFNKQVSNIDEQELPPNENDEPILPQNLFDGNASQVSVSVKACAILDSGDSILFTENYKCSIIQKGEDGKYQIQKVSYAELEEEDEIILSPNSSLPLEDNLIYYLFENNKKLLDKNENDSVEFILAWKNELRDKWNKCNVNRWWEKVGVCKQTMETWAFGNTILPNADDSIQSLTNLLEMDCLKDLATVRNHGQVFINLRRKMEKASNDAILSEKNNQNLNDEISNIVKNKKITKIYTIERIIKLDLPNIPYNKVNRPIK